MDVDLRPLREHLRDALGSAPSGWLFLPTEDRVDLDTLGAIIDDPQGDDHDDDEEDVDTVVISGVEFGSTVDGVTLHDICVGAAQLQPQPTDKTLLDAFVYYDRFDAFLPALGAPDPPPWEEINAQLHREFWDRLGDEDPDRPCRHEGCGRGSVAYSVLCRVHHFESVKNVPCPFDT